MGLDKEEEKLAVCKYCEERVSWGGTSVKNYNTTNLRNHLWHFTHKLFDKLVTKECDDEKKKERGRGRRSPWEKGRKQGEARQLTFVVLKQ